VNRDCAAEERSSAWVVEWTSLERVLPRLLRLLAVEQSQERAAEDFERAPAAGRSRVPVVERSRESNRRLPVVAERSPGRCPQAAAEPIALHIPRNQARTRSRQNGPVDAPCPATPRRCIWRRTNIGVSWLFTDLIAQLPGSEPAKRLSSADRPRHAHRKTKCCHLLFCDCCPPPYRSTKTPAD
jgi:hypothetical protein